MTVVNLNKLALTTLSKNLAAEKYKKLPIKVLDEDVHITNLEKIITRDFFPDLPKIIAQNEYLEALEKKDTNKLWQLRQKYSMKRPSTSLTIRGTPSTFETPEASLRMSPTTIISAAEADKNLKNRMAADYNNGGEDSGCSTMTALLTHSINNNEVEEEGVTRNPEPHEASDAQILNLSLDRYLSKNTSEDNISFIELMNEEEKKHRFKHAWVYKTPALKGKEEDKGVLETWNYVPQNAVMYVPDGVRLTDQEKLELSLKKQEIRHPNTRFQEIPFDPQLSKQTLEQIATVQMLRNEGKIGPDGKEIMPLKTPTVGGYGFLATPSPAPGVDASPLMHWGEIEGSPFLLDGSDTPRFRPNTCGGGPTFKIPDVPKKDQLLYRLAEKASKLHRAKKEEALKQATATLTYSPKIRNKTDRLQFLSPAAQRLAAKKLGLKCDSSLRASYTPSPQLTTPNGQLVTPSPKGRTPDSLTPTNRKPDSVKLGSTPSERKKKNLKPVLITDDLLKLPLGKRSKAADFF